MVLPEKVSRTTKEMRPSHRAGCPLPCTFSLWTKDEKEAT